MQKRKEDVSAKQLKHDVQHAHHEVWLANIVALVTVLVFAVYALMTREAVNKIAEEMSARLSVVEALCANK